MVPYHRPVSNSVERLDDRLRHGDMAVASTGRRNVGVEEEPFDQRTVIHVPLEGGNVQ